MSFSKRHQRHLSLIDFACSDIPLMVVVPAEEGEMCMAEEVVFSRVPAELSEEPCGNLAFGRAAIPTAHGVGLVVLCHEHLASFIIEGKRNTEEVADSSDVTGIAFEI